MRRPFLQLFVVACLVGVAVSGRASHQSMTFSKTDIAAPPEAVFALIEDFRNWPKWSLRDKAGPTVKQIYGGAEKGPGATYEWDGDGKIGAGRARITEAIAARSIAVEFDLSRPHRGGLTVTFALQPNGAATKLEVGTEGDEHVVQYIMDRFFVGQLSLIACEVEKSSKPICTFLRESFGPK